MKEQLSVHKADETIVKGEVDYNNSILNTIERITKDKMNMQEYEETVKSIKIDIDNSSNMLIGDIAKRKSILYLSNLISDNIF